MTDYSRLPAHMQDGARRYIERGIPGGSFFTAVVSNDLMGAFRNADDVNTAAMREWCVWMSNEAPIGSFGSPERVSDWIKQGGMSAYSDNNSSIKEQAS